MIWHRGITQRHAPRRRVGGFTLLELLIVVVIISLLAALLLPVLAVVRQKAWATTCTSNLKQIGLGLLQYNQDYDENEPLEQFNLSGENSRCASSCTAYLPGQAAAPQYAWSDAIYPYINSENVFECPTLFDNYYSGGKYDAYEYEFRAGANGNDFGSYLANSSFNEYMPGTAGSGGDKYGRFGPLTTAGNIANARPVSLSLIVNSATTILCGEGGNFTNGYFKAVVGFGPDNSYGGTQCAEDSAGNLPCAYYSSNYNGYPALVAYNENAQLVGIHPGGMVNCLFCDGHAKALRPDTIAGTTGPNGYPVYLCVGGG